MTNLKKVVKITAAVIMLAVFAFPCLAEEQAINVLCYHRFKKMGAGNDPYWISPGRFESHLAWLKDNGYNVVPMKRYIDFIEGGEREMPEKSVVITIDDGFKDAYTIAYPLLKKYGYSAMVFLYEMFFPGGRNAMTPADAKEMLADGFEFGCHSKTHPYLTSRKKFADNAAYFEMLKQEIVEPKAYLEKKLGVTVTAFAYPYGLYSSEITATAKEAGYAAAFSVVPSCNTAGTPRYCLKRTMIYSSDKAEKLAKILAKKPLKLAAMSPGDSEITAASPITITAVLAEDSLLNTATIKFKMGRVLLKDSVYDPAERELTYVYTKKPLGPGVHVATVTAEGKDGGEYEYAWMFVIGQPVKE